MSERKWFAGNPHGVVVDDQDWNPERESLETFEYYGGNVIAESIGDPKAMALILAAPIMLDALKMVLPTIKTMLPPNNVWFVGDLQKVIDLAETLNFEFEVVFEDKDHFQIFSIKAKTRDQAVDDLATIIGAVYPGQRYHLQKVSITNILPHKELKQS